MADVLTDAEIARLIAERKVAPKNFWARCTLKPKAAHTEAEVPLPGADGSQFVLIVRQNNLNPFDFSVILAYERTDIHERFLLRRYNGRSHEHSNVLENEPRFYDFHIHYATERYQRAGMKEEFYALVTDRFSDWRTAVACMAGDCAIDVPTGSDGFFPVI
jgi:hypothetical protein